MSKNIKALFGVLLFLTLLTVTGIALAGAYASTHYFPIIYKQPTLTPTPTITVTPTPQATVLITYIEADPSGPDIESEYVTIKNQSSSSVVMTGWALKDNTSTTFEFPSFTLKAGREVKVWSRAKTADDTDTENNLYWGLISGIWDNRHDCGFLYDEDGHLVDEYCYERPQ